MRQRIASFLFFFILAISTSKGEPAGAKPGHPRLYLTAAEAARLRAIHDELRAKIWTNLASSADWCLTQTPRQHWIAPFTPDPVYENLYDRFYGIMRDMAIMEHLSFAYALSGNQAYGEAAKRWVLNSCRVWQHEAAGEPDSGTGYAVSRLLKGVAVGYDLAYDQFSDAERQEIRGTLARIGGMYFDKYFMTPARFSGSEFHTHHAIVEWASFGVMALALLDETPEARTWLDATVKKFETQLLPEGLAPDGAQIEGATFWASTMQYRMFFMDALRHVTGRDLFKPFEKQMNADLALAAVANIKTPGYNQDQTSVILEPYYGQLDYYSPVLLKLAREYYRPIFQYLALWDSTLGQLQKTRAITPHGEQLLFDLGPYAYLWCDSSVPAQPDEPRLSYAFPSVRQAYARSSWRPGDLVAGVSDGLMVVHAGGQPILIEPHMSNSGIEQDLPADLTVPLLEDDGKVAKIRCAQNSTNGLTIELDRTEHKLFIRRRIKTEWQWWCQGRPVRDGNELRWGDQVTLRVVQGEITRLENARYAPILATGFNKLRLADPMPMKFPVVSARPSSNDEVDIEIRCRP